MESEPVDFLFGLVLMIFKISSAEVSNPEWKSGSARFACWTEDMLVRFAGESGEIFKGGTLEISRLSIATGRAKGEVEFKESMWFAAKWFPRASAIEAVSVCRVVRVLSENRPEEGEMVDLSPVWRFISL